jgi:hypothetical protein
LFLLLQLKLICGYSLLEAVHLHAETLIFHAAGDFAGVPSGVERQTEH